MLPLLLTLLSAPDPFDPGPNPLLMRHPTMNRDTIVFQFADDLWSVPRTGGQAVRLTTAPGVESNPFFSPDGEWIAFSGQYDGNTDVYVVNRKGGVPVRLTAHPSPDIVLGWPPDGKSVLFSSNMLSNTDYPRMFTVPLTGGVPQPLPFPSGRMGCFSPDGKQIAYVPTLKWQEAWKRYRGGQTAPIWIGQMSDSHVKAIPRGNEMDEYPMWVGDSIYYLSDKHGPVGLNRFDTRTGRVTEEIKGEGFDLKSATAGPGGIVYERLGSINIYDPSTKTSKRVPIEINGDFPEVRTQFKPVRPGGFSISPSGMRIAAESRGQIFTIPASKGDIRQITDGTGPHRRDPAWSPDGKRIAWVTDENRAQQIALYDAATAKVKLIDAGEPPAIYGGLAWSPDSKKLLYTDERQMLWVLDIASAKNTKVAQLIYRARTSLDPAWSPDSKWIAYTRDLPNHYSAVFLYNLETGKSTQITEGLADAGSPVFDRDGKTLYFLASTTLGTASDFEDLSGFTTPNSPSNVYAFVLRKDLPNPLQPESDEEGAAPSAKSASPNSGIDLDQPQRRIIALPLPAALYSRIEPGPAGSFFVISEPLRTTISDFNPAGATLTKFSFTDRKAVPFATGVTVVQTNADGSKMLLGSRTGLAIVSTAMPPTPGQGVVSTEGAFAKIDPREEWRHMYHEVWDQERMLLYDPHLHGIDATVMEKRYEPFLDGIASRDDLNYLFTDMLGEISVGHMFIGGGDSAANAKSIPGGLLGADYTFENGRYRLSRIYDGEAWNPGLAGPLAQPGINAQVGEYVLAFDGKDLTDVNDIYLALEGKAGKQVKVKLGPNPNGVGSREVTVVPVSNEFNLRFRAWTEDNRRRVERMTGGRCGYMQIPDTSPPGFTEFNRYYYAQANKDAIIVDDRFNHGGAINDYMVHEMEHALDYGSMTRYGKDIVIPTNLVYGPKVMLINEGAGSGGDIFPHLFRKHKLGPLVGKRTWGAMISAFGFSLADGGSVRAPDDAMYDTRTGKWVIENEGVPPDVDVELDPYLWRQGRDAQLEKAIEIINQKLRSYHPMIKRPAYPDKTKVGG